MPDRQISQLVLQVDANIAVAQRELQNLARVVNQSAGQMNNALGSTDQAVGRTLSAHHQLGLSFNNARIAQMELTAAVTRSVDAYGAGASPIRILSTEIGRLTEAAGFLGGGAGNGVLGSIVRFMGGPWGIALLVAGSILAKLALSHKDAGDSVEALVEKMRKQAEQAHNSKLADDEWAHSIDGLIDRNTKLTDELKKRLHAEEDLDNQTLRNAQQDKQKAEDALSQDRVRLANLQRELGAAQTQTTYGGGSVPGSALASQDNRVAAIQRQIDEVNADIAKQTQGITSAQDAIKQNTIAVGEALGKALADSGAAVDLWARNYLVALHTVEEKTPGATTQISAAFESLKSALSAAAGEKVGFKGTADSADKLAGELAHGKISVNEYTSSIQKLVKALLAAVEAAKEAKKHTQGEFGKQISFADAAAIAKNAGLTVTSGYRSTADQARLFNDPAYNHPGNPVARPGTSAHEGINGKWALDIAFAPGLTPEKIRKLYGAEGVSLSAIYKESGHYHIEGSRSQAASEERAAAAAAKKQLLGDDTFARESAQLDAEMLQARKGLVGGYDTLADLASKEVEAQKNATLDAIQKQKDGGQITADQAEELSLQAENLAASKEAVIAHHKYLEGLNQLAESARQSADFQIEDLRFADEMAKTQGEHRKLQLAILDIQYQQKDADLQRLLLSIQSNKDFATSVDLQRQALEVQGQIARLPIERAQDQQRVQQGTLSPLDAYLNDLPRTTAQINQRVQEIEVGGLQDAVNVLAEFRHGWKAARDAAIQALDDISGRLLKLGLDEVVGKLFKTGKSTASEGAGLAAAGSSLGVAGGALNTAGATLTSSATIWQGVALQLQAAAAQLAAAGAAGGGGGGLGGIGGILGLLGGGGGAAAAGGGDIALSGLYDDALSGLPGLASGGWREIGGIGGTDNNVLSINGVPLAMVSMGEKLAVIPNTPRISYPRHANGNMRGGDTYHNHFHVRDTGDPLKNRQTGMQYAAGFEAGMASRRRKGLAG